MLNPKLTSLKNVDISKIVSKNDCLCCVYRWMMFVGTIFGIAPIVCLCPHSKSYYSQTTCFQISQKYKFVNIFYVIFMTPAILLDLNILKEENKLNSQVNIIEHISISVLGKILRI